MGRRILSCVPFLLVVPPLSALGVSEPQEAQSGPLAGLESIQVRVALSEVAGELNPKNLFTDVSLELRVAGVKVEQFKAAAFLYVYVTLYKLQAPSGFGVEDQFGYAFYCSAELKEPVLLARNPSLSVEKATTWKSTYSVGSFPPDGEGYQFLRRRVRDKVREFVNAYLAANPRPE